MAIGRRPPRPPSAALPPVLTALDPVARRNIDSQRRRRQRDPDAWAEEGAVRGDPGTTAQPAARQLDLMTATNPTRAGECAEPRRDSCDGARMAHTPAGPGAMMSLGYAVAASGGSRVLSGRPKMSLVAMSVTDPHRYGSIHPLMRLSFCGTPRTYPLPSTKSPRPLTGARVCLRLPARLFW